MFTIIVGCIIANLLTIVIIGASLYFVYRKNQDKIDAVADKIETRIVEIKDEIAKAKESIATVVETVESIKSALDKLPFSAQ